MPESETASLAAGIAMSMGTIGAAVVTTTLGGRQRRGAAADKVAGEHVQPPPNSAESEAAQLRAAILGIGDAIDELIDVPIPPEIDAVLRPARRKLIDAYKVARHAAS